MILLGTPASMAVKCFNQTMSSSTANTYICHGFQSDTKLHRNHQLLLSEMWFCWSRPASMAEKGFSQSWHHDNQLLLCTNIVFCWIIPALGTIVSHMGVHGNQSPGKTSQRQTTFILVAILPGALYYYEDMDWVAQYLDYSEWMRYRDHSACTMVSQWSNNVKSLWVCSVLIWSKMLLEFKIQTFEMKQR